MPRMAVATGEKLEERSRLRAAAKAAKAWG